MAKHPSMCQHIDGNRAKGDPWDMDEETIRVEKRGAIRLLVLNRPDKRNALSTEVLHRLERVLGDLARDQETRVLVIRGAGDQAFCAGFDLRDLTQTGLPGTHGLAPHPLDRVFRAIEDFPYPVFAQLNGSAYGGGYELAVCCDLRIAADDIRIAVPSVKLGIVYPWQGLARLLRLLGPSVTKKLLFTARSFKGAEIERLGLVDYMVERSALEDLTFQLAEAVAAQPVGAIQGTKKAIGLLLQKCNPSEQIRAECDRLTAESWQSRELRLAYQALLNKSDREVGENERRD